MRKQMKWVSITFMLVLLLTGCGKNAQSNATEAASAQETKQETSSNQEDTSYDFTLAFAGDINFDENWSTMQYYESQGEDISKCISSDLIADMNAADLMWINNEFTYSTRGTPLNGKAYTFRANPKRVEILKELGVDIAGLANNHIYDYGSDALVDTLDTLDSAGIPYVGAGRNIEEASSPVYLEVDGKTIAYVAASRAEKNKMTPQATENTPGILRCYDNSEFIEEIKEADANADYVIALVHWGTEYSYDLESVQTETGHEYIDAGADAVVGAHTHCLQGMEYYNGKPIIYSLGNFWFNEKTLDSMLLELHISGDEDKSEMQVEVIPAIQKNHVTSKVTDENEKNRIFDFLTSISNNIKIDANGIVKQK